ncbi:FAD-binding oxidoreductase [Barrientosiimonas marina]|uniref:FAD-binding protein n=1 Tax=Lentibacillus kimchii TaxID=1542911 RepID=A0ABW2UVV9_9BACI
MAKPTKREMSGWGHYPRLTGFVHQPETIGEMQRILREAGGEPQIAYGLGRSYGDAALNEDAGMIRTDQLTHLLAFDEATGMLTCEAGVTLSDIMDVFLPRGYFPAVTPGTAYVTVGGAIANDVHGKNHHRDGSFAECVESFDLLLASGDIITCSREQNPEAFWATIGGIGLTGLIVRATLKLMPVESSGIRVTYEKAANLGEALDKFAAQDQDYRYSVAWIDCLSEGDSLGRSVLMRGEHAAADEWQPANKSPLAMPDKPSLKMPVYAPGFVLNRWSIKAFNNLYYRSYKNETKLVDLASFFHPLDAIQDWNKFYGKNGFVQYQAVFPKNHDPEEGVRRVLEKLSHDKRASFLAVLKSSGPASGGLLSFPVEGYTLALDLPIKDNSLFPFLRELDAIVLAHGGRVYLAKDAVLDADTFRAMYPSWQRFMDVKRQLDPEGLFSSSMARRIALDDHYDTARWL